MAAEIAANRTAREMEKKADQLNAPNWSFPSAFLYALSIITTIGNKTNTLTCTIQGIHNRSSMPLGRTGCFSLTNQISSWFLRGTVASLVEDHACDSIFLFGLFFCVNALIRLTHKKNMKHKVRSPSHHGHKYYTAVNQSIDQSINQSIDQSINQSINRSINQSIDQSINQWKQSINWVNFKINLLNHFERSLGILSFLQRFWWWEK